jgi:hypothetical protein
MHRTSLKLDALVKAHAEAVKARKDLETNRRAELHVTYVAAGGCCACGGSRRVCTWSTLDGAGWEDWGACKGVYTPPTDEERAAGKYEGTYAGCTHNPAAGYCPCGHGSTGGTWGVHTPGYQAPDIWVQSPALFAERTRLEGEVSELEQAIRSEKVNLAPARGKRLEVFKGRKVAKGTQGVCFWLGVDNWGTEKVGIELADGSKAYVAESYTAVVLDDDGNAIREQTQRDKAQAAIPVVVTRDTKWLTVSAPYRASATSAWRAIPGRRFEGSTKANLVPIGQEGALKALLAAHYSDAQVVGL